MQPKRIPPGPGQESVWDYPRPPRVENSPRRVRILLAERVIVDTRRALRVLETSSPPTYYFSREDVAARLTPTGRDYVCEFKGRAIYYTVAVDGCVETGAAWQGNRI